MGEEDGKARTEEGLKRRVVGSGRNWKEDRNAMGP